MQTLVSWFSGGIVVLSLILAMIVGGDEETISLDKVPKPVLDAVKTRFEAATLTGASRETKDGKLLYEVTIKDEGRTIDVTLTPEGEIELLEKEIAFRDLGKVAARTLEIKYPKAVYKIVEEVFTVEKKEEKLAYYEVLLETAEQHALEVQVTTDGKIINEEKKDSQEDAEINSKENSEKNSDEDSEKRSEEEDD